MEKYKRLLNDLFNRFNFYVNRNGGTYDTLSQIVTAFINEVGSNQLTMEEFEKKLHGKGLQDKELNHCKQLFRPHAKQPVLTNQGDANAGNLVPDEKTQKNLAYVDTQMRLLHFEALSQMLESLSIYKAYEEEVNDDSFVDFIKDARPEDFEDLDLEDNEFKSISFSQNIAALDTDTKIKLKKEIIEKRIKELQKEIIEKKGIFAREGKTALEFLFNICQEFGYIKNIPDEAGIAWLNNLLKNTAYMYINILKRIDPTLDDKGGRLPAYQDLFMEIYRKIDLIADHQGSEQLLFIQQLFNNFLKKV